ncbi:hypothetical protein ABZ479_14785 [Streptomyces sp. NPDC005722]
MNGPGPVPPYPPAQSKAAATTLRVVFLTITAFSCGYLSSLALLHLAIQRRRAKDWVLFWLSATLTVASFVTVGSLPTTDPWTDAAVIPVMLMVPVVGVYYLLADLALHRANTAPPHPPYAATVPYPPPHQPGPPQPPANYNPYLTPPPPAPQAPPPQSPVPPHQPRINQVRAELDELSDLLRKQEGGQ